MQIVLSFQKLFVLDKINNSTTFLNPDRVTRAPHTSGVVVEVGWQTCVHTKGYVVKSYHPYHYKR